MHNYIVKMLRCDKPVSNFISSSFFNIPVFFNETLAWEQQKQTKKTKQSTKKKWNILNNIGITTWAQTRTSSELMMCTKLCYYSEWLEEFSRYTMRKHCDKVTFWQLCTREHKADKHKALREMELSVVKSTRRERSFSRNKHEKESYFNDKVWKYLVFNC